MIKLLSTGYFHCKNARNERVLFCAARRIFRWAETVLLFISLIGVTAFFPASGHAQGLECPETGRSAAPPLIEGESQIRRMTTENNVDLGNEISVLISRLKAENPSASNDSITEILIAAYCPVVAHMPNASAAEKWRLMRQFDRVLMQQLSANTMPQGALIIANVPLPPPIYQKLSSRAKAGGQTTADLMADILIRATGQ